MNVLYEKERKYLIDEIDKKDVWEKEHIVYQWYVEISEGGSIKEKLIFDILRNRVIAARIQKQSLGYGESRKKVEYLDINNFSIEEKMGVPFILKRRSIKQNHFLDHFISSNMICEYLLEIEDVQCKDAGFAEYKIVEDVTNDLHYYNQNMCVPFEKNDAEKLHFLLSIF